MLWKFFFYQGNHFLGDGVRRKGHGLGYPARPLAAKTATIVAVVIPTAALGLAILHQNTAALAYKTVPLFHAVLLSPLGPGVEDIEGKEKAVIVIFLVNHIETRAEGANRFAQLPVTGLGAKKFARPISLQGLLQLLDEALASTIAKGMIEDGQAALL